jgi:peptide/nickel transport system substrate-binding protein
MAESYWGDFVGRRLNRRRALTTTAGAGLAAAILAACGSSGSSSSPGKDANNLVTQPEDTSKGARRGGVLKSRNSADPATLDPAGAVAPLNLTVENVYSTLVREKPGFQAPSKGELSPDIAESWERSPDGLQLTLKLRQGIKWHNKAPVNARALDVDDVLFSWNRFVAKSALRGLVVNSANAQAPVLSLTAPDSKTIAIKLKEPLVYALEWFASFGSFSGNMILVPKETDSTFEIKGDMIGTGPFYLSDYKSSQGFVLKRNQDYFDPDFALIDQFEAPIVGEYAAVLSQLKAGNIYFYAVRPEDITAVKREEPRLQIYPTDLTPNTNAFTFGMLPDGKSPFMDERVRQAVSMSWDRDLWIDTFYNVSNFKSQALPVATRWNSHLAASWDGWWLDPQGKDFGPNAKYFQHDPAEAKKLLAAAGYPNGIPGILSNHITTSELTDLPKQADALDGMMRDVGIQSSVHAINYATEYSPNYRDGNGQYEGWLYHTVTGTTPIRISPVSSLASEYWPNSGVTFKGFSSSGKNDKGGDPQVNALIEKARLEADVEKRRALTYDIQRLLAKGMYGLVMPGGASGFTMAWPALRNFQVYRGPSAFINYKLWIDDTKPPLKNA